MAARSRPKEVERPESTALAPQASASGLEYPSSPLDGDVKAPDGDSYGPNIYDLTDDEVEARADFDVVHGILYDINPLCHPGSYVSGPSGALTQIDTWFGVAVSDAQLWGRLMRLALSKGWRPPTDTTLADYQNIREYIEDIMAAIGTLETLVALSRAHGLHPVLDNIATAVSKKLDVIEGYRQVVYSYPLPRLFVDTVRAEAGVWAGHRLGPWTYVFFREGGGAAATYNLDMQVDANVDTVLANVATIISGIASGADRQKIIRLFTFLYPVSQGGAMEPVGVRISRERMYNQHMQAIQVVNSSVSDEFQAWPITIDSRAGVKVESYRDAPYPRLFTLLRPNVGLPGPDHSNASAKSIFGLFIWGRNTPTTEPVLEVVVYERDGTVNVRTFDQPIGVGLDGWSNFFHQFIAEGTFFWLYFAAQFGVADPYNGISGPRGDVPAYAGGSFEITLHQLAEKTLQMYAVAFGLEPGDPVFTAPRLTTS